MSIRVKEIKLFLHGSGSYAFRVPKDYIKNGLLNIKKKYNLVIKEVT